MLKIVVGGQLFKKETVDLIEKLGGDKVTVTVKGDLDAAMDLKSGNADYYFGSCNTGGGGALAMAIALNGASKCVTVAMVGKVLDDEQLREAVRSGKKAFGFVPEAREGVVPVLMEEILKTAG